MPYPNGQRPGASKKPQSKALTLSLVIPAYNEERHLKACLDAVAAQTVRPLEVIVVNNNSRDNTAEIAASYPFVTLLHESRQGLIPARNTGFAAARGDILGRIDADSVIEPRWVEKVLARYQANQKLMVFGGVGITNTIPKSGFGNTKLWSIIYSLAVEAVFGVPVVWGANMSIRRTMWQRIAKNVCLYDAEVHEDQDITCLVTSQGGLVERDSDVLITTAGQSYFEWPKLSEYMVRSWRTKRRHVLLGNLPAHSALRLTVLQRSWRASCVLVPSLCFIVVSFIFWLPHFAYDFARLLLVSPTQTSQLRDTIDGD